MTAAERIRAVAHVAQAWRDPEHPARAAAVEATLEAPNRFTQEGLAFALNHRMHQATPAAQEAWMGSRSAEQSGVVGVVCGEGAPLSGWEAALAGVLLGHEAVIATSDVSPALLPTFWAEVLVPDGVVTFASRQEVLDRADALVAEGSDEAMHALAAEADAAGIPEVRRSLTSPGLSVAVIDGREDAAARSGLAEDLLLHEGVTPASPAIVWAPAGREPDALLDTLAAFRELFPPHPDTDGTLALPTAFLASAKQPHATGPGFLVSKGAPEPQGQAHIRWAEYASLDEVADWLRAQPGRPLVVATPEVARRLDASVPTVVPGDVHRPTLGTSLVEFLSGL